jgi:hypothetical protein
VLSSILQLPNWSQQFELSSLPHWTQQFVPFLRARTSEKDVHIYKIYSNDTRWSVLCFLGTQQMGWYVPNALVVPMFPVRWYVPMGWYVPNGLICCDVFWERSDWESRIFLDSLVHVPNSIPSEWISGVIFRNAASCPSPGWAQHASANGRWVWNAWRHAQSFFSACHWYEPSCSSFMRRIYIYIYIREIAVFYLSIVVIF